MSSAPRLITPSAGFLGAPVETDLERLVAGFATIGVPHGVAYPFSATTAGCADAPTAIRAASQRLARFRGHWDFDADGPMLPLQAGPRLVDCGDVPGMAGQSASNAERTEATIRALLERHAIPIILGGDDSIPIPVLRAFEGRGPLLVLQVDAHLDFRDEVDGVRDGYSSPMRRASEMAHVGRIVQVGLRGVGSARPADVEDARAAGNLLVTVREMRARGMAWLLDQIPADASVFVSFDLDGLDPSVVAAVSAPVPGGLLWDEASDLLAAVSRRSLAGAAFTEYRPDLDGGGIGAMVATRLIVRLLGG